MECIANLIDKGSVESSRYFLSRGTVLEMLADRGYDVVQHANLVSSLSDFRSRFGQQPNHEALGFCVSHLSNPSNTVQVAFAGTDTIKMTTVMEICSRIVDGGSLKSLIIILQSKITSYAHKKLMNLPFKVEIIRIEDLLINITKHVLRPKYEILTDEEKKALLTKHSLEEKQLPCMLRSDVIARYYGLEKGQVVKITHSGPMVDSHATYRCVA
ncbi:DNA-directed RNA polymerase V subunit 5C-like isoform X1 [Vigna unguiculata]|uniref:DNA-directed RNA polymerases I n=1 Tax=Vigna unguiculata TaxID=3917 RepID=A0A4D6M4S2_VIGUN|nr:DNA-directed RNA polymerase V subunit 5C-like isoform X1 [Vigna unguiculata]XP_027904547.1 DNA-directed RNA polymerase V subunit 5C-like isoform X1 [Vigna unguiculata]QCD95710.1 DNA-directed RNA polymerases I [Vigna unguiculata]